MPIGSNSTIELLTLSEVAKILRVSPSGVRRLQRARQLPFIKIGGSLRFSKDDVGAFVQRQRVESIGN
jgi:excisionase family DNA binding protein